MAKGLEALRQEASAASRWRGHMPKWHAPWHGEGRSIQDGECERPGCGATAQLCTHPQPNGIDVGGTMIATSCLDTDPKKADLLPWGFK